MNAQAMTMQAAQMQAMQQAMAGKGFPGAYPGMMGFPPPYPQADGKGFGAAGFGEFSKGKGEFSFKGKGKGKSKGKFKASPDADEFSNDPRRLIERAQRLAKQRDRSAINQAQREAQMRFEKDLLDRVQGNWVDASDPSVSYEVEGKLCSVSGGENSRTFRNRLGVYGGELCWDARRFWHNLNFSALPPAGEEVTRVEWNPAEGSPPTKQIVWVKGPPKAEGEEVPKAEGEEDPPAEGPAEAISPEAPAAAEAEE